jgi:hypothetical protein
MKRFADVVMAKGYKLVSDGTDNHLVLIDLKPQGVRVSSCCLVMAFVCLFHIRFHSLSSTFRPWAWPPRLRRPRELTVLS